MYDSVFLDGWRGTAPGRPYVLLLDSDRIVLEWAPAIANPGSAPVAGYEVSSEFNLESFYRVIDKNSLNAWTKNLKVAEIISYTETTYFGSFFRFLDITIFLLFIFTFVG